MDQYLNIKLSDVSVVDAEKFPQLVRRFSFELLSYVRASFCRSCVFDPLLLSIPIPLDLTNHPPFFFVVKLSIKNCFIRGSVVRFVQIHASEVDTDLLQDAARREASQGDK